MRSLLKRSLRRAVLITALPMFAQVSTGDLIQLHVAEYNAITTRCTYLITLQYTLLPALLVYLSFLTYLAWQAEAPGSVRPHKLRSDGLVWGGFCGSLFMGHLWVDDLSELYNSIKYLEQGLRPVVKGLVHDPRFWCYESFQANRRGSNLLWWEWSVAGVAVLLFLVIVFLRIRSLSRNISGEQHRPRFPWGDLVGGLVSALLIAALLWKTYDAMNVRLTMAPTVCL